MPLASACLLLTFASAFACLLPLPGSYPCAFVLFLVLALAPGLLALAACFLLSSTSFSLLPLASCCCSLLACSSCHLLPLRFFFHILPLSACPLMFFATLKHHGSEWQSRLFPLVSCGLASRFFLLHLAFFLSSSCCSWLSSYLLPCPLLLVIDSLTSSPVPSTGVGGYMHIIFFFLLLVSCPLFSYALPLLSTGVGELPAISMTHSHIWRFPIHVGTPEIIHVCIFSFSIRNISKPSILSVPPFILVPP